MNQAVVSVVRGDAPDRIVCPRCRGTGEAKTLEMGMFRTVACPRCQGHGVVAREESR